MEEIFISVIRLLIILIFFVGLSPKQLFATDSNETDYESLDAFKNQFLMQSNGHPPTIFMSSWNNTNHFCSWEGVSCGHKHRDRVIALDINSSGLAGFLPPGIANLTFLKILDLSNNNLHGEIPPNLSRLQRLQYLNLSFNSLRGEIPANLMMNHSSVLQVLDLSSNQFITEYSGAVGPSTSADVYSFGIIFLEMLTGRRPTDDIFKDNLNLYNHVKMAFPRRINDIVYLKMFNQEQRDGETSNGEEARRFHYQSINNCLLSLAEVGLACSTLLPEERPSIRVVNAKLRAIRVSYFQSKLMEASS